MTNLIRLSGDGMDDYTPTVLKNLFLDNFRWFFVHLSILL